MTVPSTRTPVRIARGSYANLTTVDALASLAEGELAFATDTDQLYVKKGAVLVPVSSSGDGFSGDYNDLTNKPSIPAAPGDIGAATAAQGVLADTAVQPGDAVSGLTNDANYITSAQAPVQPGDLFSGSYNDLTDKPSIPSTPGDIGAATAAQGALADSAIQPGDVNPVYFANQAAFPDANTNHGAIAHSHADGAMYFAHGGVWNRMANTSEIPAVNNIDLASLPTLP